MWLTSAQRQRQITLLKNHGFALPNTMQRRRQTWVCQHIETTGGGLRPPPHSRGTDMTDQEIKDIYDSNPNMTLATLAIMAGVSVEELKKILMEEVA